MQTDNIIDIAIFITSHSENALICESRYFFQDKGHTNIDGHCIDTLAKISNLKSLSL